MPDTPNSPDPQPSNIWMRGLFMLLMAMAFQLASTLLCLLALFQFVLRLLNQRANPRLMTFARSLASYLGQIAEFVGFAAEDIPFPFADWPSAANREATDSHPKAD